MGIGIVRLKEAQRDYPQTFCDYRQCKLVIRQDMEVDWSPLDMLSTSILEILVPNDVLEVKYAVKGPKGHTERGVLLQHNPQVNFAINRATEKIIRYKSLVFREWLNS